jgi:hypothetical protein
VDDGALLKLSSVPRKIASFLKYFFQPMLGMGACLHVFDSLLPSVLYAREHLKSV